MSRCVWSAKNVADGESVAAVARSFNVSRQTVYLALERRVQA
ncbi:helix-turn-helix domain-containing protein [Micrococcus luteus]